MFIFRCVYGILGREITKFMVIYGVYIRFWPTLNTLYADVQGNTRIHVLENIQRPRSVCTCTHYSHTHRVGQNRIYTPNMTVCMVIYVLKIPYIHCIYSYMYMLVLANSKHTHTTNCRHAVYHKCTYTHYSHIHTHHKLQACGVPQEPAHGRTCRGFRTHAAAARWHHGVHGCRSTRHRHPRHHPRGSGEIRRTLASVMHAHGLHHGVHGCRSTGHRHPRHHPRGSGEKKRMLASVTHAQGLHHGVHGCRSTGHRHPRRHPRGSGEKRRMLASVTHARTRLASWYGCCSTGHRHPRHHPRGSGEKRRMLASVTHV